MISCTVIEAQIVFEAFLVLIMLDMQTLDPSFF